MSGRAGRTADFLTQAARISLYLLASFHVAHYQRGGKQLPPQFHAKTPAPGAFILPHSDDTDNDGRALLAPLRRRSHVNRSGRGRTRSRRKSRRGVIFSDVGSPSSPGLVVRRGDGLERQYDTRRAAAAATNTGRRSPWATVFSAPSPRATRALSKLEPPGPRKPWVGGTRSENAWRDQRRPPSASINACTGLPEAPHATSCERNVGVGYAPPPPLPPPPRPSRRRPGRPRRRDTAAPTTTTATRVTKYTISIWRMTMSIYHLPHHQPISHIDILDDHIVMVDDHIETNIPY